MTVTYYEPTKEPHVEYCDRCTEAAEDCCCQTTLDRYGTMNCAACGYNYVKVSGERAVPGYPSLRAQWLYGSIRLPCGSCNHLFCADMLLDIFAAYVTSK